MIRFLLGIGLSACMAVVCAADAGERRISLTDYRDRMQAAWLGQVVGVVWGAPTEFHYQGGIMPADRVPKWQPEMVNGAFAQDDVYVEMTFLRSMERYGYDVDIRQAAIDFANSEYELCHANARGRRNLRAGLAPPDCSHPFFNPCADDIDYQIEADFSGIVSPGLPQSVIRLGEKFGRLVNYGDGLYAGQFVGAMYAEAFFERDPVRIVEHALAAIPAQSRYAGMVRDVLAWHRECPSDFTVAWNKLNEKYQKAYCAAVGGCRQQPGVEGVGIDATLNGGVVLLGLLWGDGDIEKTIAIAMRGGWDSDCNPSSAAGVLFTSIGLARIPATFSEKLDLTRKFSHTEYTFPELLKVSEKIAREAVVKNGGRIERDADGQEWLVVPRETPRPSEAVSLAKPGPVVGSIFTEEENSRILFQPFCGLGLQMGVKSVRKVQ